MKAEKSPSNAEIRGAILDVDGTLIDSNDAHAHAWVEALTQSGYETTFEALRPLIGMGGDHLLPRVANIAADSPEGRKVSALRKDVFQSKYLPKLRAFPNARDLLERMREHGIKMVVASSAEVDELTKLLKICGADKLVAEAVSSDDVDSSKPDPDVVSAALRKLALPAVETLMLGDTPYDVQAARKAQVAIVALRCGGWNDRQLSGAAAIYDDPADLLRNFNDSPFVRAVHFPS
jgi:HAD superfamily hydrolase (TIGR01509 family)